MNSGVGEENQGMGLGELYLDLYWNHYDIRYLKKGELYYRKNNTINVKISNKSDTT